MSNSQRSTLNIEQQAPHWVDVQEGIGAGIQAVMGGPRDYFLRRRVRTERPLAICTRTPYADKSSGANST